MALGQLLDDSWALGAGPSVRLRVVAFLETSSDALADALAGAGGEIIQRLDTLVVAAFGSAELAMRLCAALPRDVRAGVTPTEDRDLGPGQERDSAGRLPAGSDACRPSETPSSRAAPRPSADPT
jgi:hypothetical protein